MMLNKQPIFINAFSRGGSNMLVNFLLSHPEVCISSGETHKVFKPGTRFDKGWLRVKKRLFYDLPIRLLIGQDIFYPNLVEPRKTVPQYLRRYIDQILYHGRFQARIQSHNLYKSEDQLYTDQELAKCRLLTKGLNGIVFTVDMFREMYPDATFFGLVRNGLAVCEGRVRRGYPAERFAHDYKLIVERMLQYQKEMPNYHIVKFEHLLSSPLEVLKDIYDKAGLDFNQVKKIRLESKATMDSSGNHQLNKGYDRQVFWYPPGQISDHIKPNVNENQIKNMDSKLRDQFLSISGDIMEKIGYGDR
jgi:hypothetical protein